LPRLEVCCLGRANTEQNAQNLWIADPLGQRWVEAGATLLDEGEVEARRIGYCLDVIVGGEITIVSGNRRKLPLHQTWDGWREGATQIGVLGTAAIAGPITGVYRELHEVGEPSDLLSTCRFAARQGAELIQIDGTCADRLQVGVDEGEVAHLILGIVVDILGHVGVQELDGLRVDWIPTATRDFTVLNTGEFVVLLPQIGFENLGCGQKPENGYIAFCDRGTCRSLCVGKLWGEQSRTQ